MFCNALFLLQLSQDSNVVLPPQQKDQEACPVIYGPRIYFPASQVARKFFMDNPERYIGVPSPGPAVPIRLAIVGPPKSGKSTGKHIHNLTYAFYLQSQGKIM